MESVSESDRVHSFPYADCWKLFENEPTELTDGFIPDIDYFSSTVFGYACSAAQAQSWSRQRIDAACNAATRSFAESHPEYKQLLSEINAADFPLLWSRLTTDEHLRVMLLELTILLKRSSFP